MDEFIEQFRTLLLQATALIEHKFYQLPIAAGNGVVRDIYRERVYCYELYHRLRTLWNENYPFTLGGEVDKNGHPLYRNTPVAYLKPDLLVHVPGNPDGNLIVIEVKAINARIHQIEKDLCTLASFNTHGNYRKGFYLVYGGTQRNFDRYKHHITRMVQRNLQCGTAENPYNENISLDYLELYWHRECGQPAQREQIVIPNPVLPPSP